MIWDDTGYLISKNKYSENSLIVELFTKNHGKVSGIVYGGSSKKIKNYLQIGNKLFANYNSKNENRIGYFKFEIIEASSPFFFDNKEKLNCLISAMQLIRILNAEAQKNLKIYDLIDNFFKLLKSENWIQNYIYWELELFSLLGYDLNLINMCSKQIKSPILALGGAGNWQHIEDLLVTSDISAACTQNIFHFTEESVQSLKQFLKNKNINIRN